MLTGTITNRALRALALAGVVVPCLGGFAASASASTTRLARSGALTASATAPTAALSTAAWEKALGAGVVVIPPRYAAPGHGSPGAAVQGFVSALDGRQLKLWCSYYEPSFQATCRSDAANFVAADLPTFKNFALGYVAIDGNKALAGSTGTDCIANGKPKCSSNANPAAIFSTGGTFKSLWAKTLAAYNNTANVYSLDLCIKIGGGWYAYVPPTS